MARAAGKKQTRRKGAGRGAKQMRARTRAGASRGKAAKRASAKGVGKRAARPAAAKPRAIRSRGAAKKRVTAKRAMTAASRKPAIRARRPAAAPAAGRPVTNRRSAPRTAVTGAFSVQREGASVRDQLLLELQRARASVKGAIQGLPAAHAVRPIAPGKWSPLEIVLHLSERDRVRLEEFARTLGGQPRTWAGVSDAEQAAVNEAHLAPLRAHSWDDAVRRLDAVREALLLRLNEVPALPDDVWKEGHPFGDMMWGLPGHDRHHAEQLKRARIGEPVPVED